MTDCPPPLPEPELPSEPHPRLRGFQNREVDYAAGKQGITPEEYGNYKGRYPGVAQPVQSAGAILALCVLLTVISAALCVGVIRSLGHEAEVAPWKLIIMAVVVSVATLASWRSFRIERRAQRLRKDSGIVLRPPTAEDDQRPVPWFYAMLPGGRHRCPGA